MFSTILANSTMIGTRYNKVDRNISILPNTGTSISGNINMINDNKKSQGYDFTNFLVISALSFPLTRNLCILPLISTGAQPLQIIARTVFFKVHSLFVAKLKLRASTKTRNNVSTNTNTTLVNIASDIRTASTTLNPSARKGANTYSPSRSILIFNKCLVRYTQSLQPLMLNVAFCATSTLFPKLTLTSISVDVAIVNSFFLSF